MSRHAFRFVFGRQPVRGELCSCFTERGDVIRMILQRRGARGPAAASGVPIPIDLPRQTHDAFPHGVQLVPGKPEGSRAPISSRAPGTRARFGRPRAVRTGNEAAFTSRLFRFALWVLGIRRQRTEPHRPWQNGRVERFVGTRQNHVRPHQHLGGRTPA